MRKRRCHVCLLYHVRTLGPQTGITYVLGALQKVQPTSPRSARDFGLPPLAWASPGLVERRRGFPKVDVRANERPGLG